MIYKESTFSTGKILFPGFGIPVLDFGFRCRDDDLGCLKGKGLTGIAAEKE